MKFSLAMRSHPNETRRVVVHTIQMLLELVEVQLEVHSRVKVDSFSKRVQAVVRKGRKNDRIFALTLPCTTLLLTLSTPSRIAL